MSDDEKTTTKTTSDTTTEQTTQAPLNPNDVKLANAPTETTEGGQIETSAATHIDTGDNLASNVKSRTTNDTEQSTEDTVEDAKALAMHNHAVEHADDPVNKTGDKTVV